MDWFSWLSRSSLDPSLVYEYGLAFVRNQLQKEDLTNFNHEFLQSMGISVAKHRLEILKLAGKEVGVGAGGGPKSKSLSKLISAAFNRTRKNIAKRINKLISHKEAEPSFKTLPAPVPEPTRHQEQWRRASWTGKCKSEEKEKPTSTIKARTRRGMAKSGPLDGRAAQETKMMLANPRLNLSGPLDRNLQERLVLTYRSPLSSGPLDGAYCVNRSPRLSGPLNGRPPSPRVHPNHIHSCKEKLVDGEFDDHTIWAALFQDLKPT